MAVAVPLAASGIVSALAGISTLATELSPLVSLASGVLSIVSAITGTQPVTDSTFASFDSSINSTISITNTRLQSINSNLINISNNTAGLDTDFINLVNAVNNVYGTLNGWNSHIATLDKLSDIETDLQQIRMEIHTLETYIASSPSSAPGDKLVVLNNSLNSDTTNLINELETIRTQMQSQLTSMNTALAFIQSVASAIAPPGSALYTPLNGIKIDFDTFNTQGAGLAQLATIQTDLANINTNIAGIGHIPAMVDITPLTSAVTGVGADLAELTTINTSIGNVNTTLGTIQSDLAPVTGVSLVQSLLNLVTATAPPTKSVWAALNSIGTLFGPSLTAQATYLPFLQGDGGKGLTQAVQAITSFGITTDVIIPQLTTTGMTPQSIADLIKANIEGVVPDLIADPATVQPFLLLLTQWMRVQAISQSGNPNGFVQP